MKKPLPADLQRWSEELASDPKSLVFLPLARAYRRQNRPDAAMRLCLRGLEHHPDNVDAHDLLALLYVDQGDHERAADEWSFVLRLDPSNFEALRGLGFCHLQNGEMAEARAGLERASLIRPDDEAVREALRFIADRMDEEDRAATGAEPWMQTPDPSLYGETIEGPTVDVREPAVAPEPDAWAFAEQQAAPPARPGAVPDPAGLFHTIIAGPVLGALLLDTQGMVMAGAMNGAGGGADALAAVLGGVAGEAARMAGLVGLGTWEGLLLETDSAVLHVAPAGADGVVLLIARAGTPPGWMMRSAASAATLAREFLEAYA